jgi:hypothetical protein
VAKNSEAANPKRTILQKKANQRDLKNKVLLYCQKKLSLLYLIKFHLFGKVVVYEPFNG